jgi:hypothetical protein
MSTALLLALAAAAQAPAAVPPLPDQRGLYRILFADILPTIAYGHSETGITRQWKQGYDLHIADLVCTQEGRTAHCRFGLSRTPDGTPTDVHAGTRANALRCRAELRYVRGPDNAPEAWRVHSRLDRGGGPARSTMRCSIDRSGDGG